MTEDSYLDRVSPATDPCPLGSQEGEDTDEDNLVGACDPVERWYSPFVAGGDDEFPAAKVGVGVVFMGVGPAGFLDTDRDDIPEGADMCPFNGDWGANANSWGERQNSWLDWTVEDVANTKLGKMIRGNKCDPYPVSTPSWQSEGGGATGGVGSSLCLKPGNPYQRH